MGTLTSLTGLYLRGNRLSGSLPESLGEFTSLTELQLCKYSMTKTLLNATTTFSKIQNIASLEAENSLSGSIPSDIAGLTGLVTVILSEYESLVHVESRASFLSLFLVIT